MAISNSNELNRSSSSISRESPEQLLTVLSEKYVDTLATEKSHGVVDSDIIASRRNNLKCGECGILLRSKSGHTNHEKKHIRDEVKKKRLAAAQKRRSMSEFNTFMCIECDRQFNRKASLTNHMKTHKVEFVCDYCHKSFKDRMDFEWHDAINDGKNPNIESNLIHRTRSKSRLSCHKAIEEMIKNRSVNTRAKSVPTQMSFTPITRSSKRLNGAYSSAESITAPSLSRSPSPLAYSDYSSSPSDLEPMDIEKDALLDDGLENPLPSIPKLNGINTASSKEIVSIETKPDQFNPKPIRTYSRIRRKSNVYTNMRIPINSVAKTDFIYSPDASHMRMDFFKCSMCNVGYTEIDLTCAHEYAVHKLLPLFKCEECRKRFTSEGLYKSHRDFEHDDKRLCLLCDYHIYYESKMLGHFFEHVRARVENRIFPCKKCSKEFFSRIDLNVHLSRNCHTVAVQKINIIRVDSNKYIIPFAKIIGEIDYALTYGSLYYDDNYRLSLECKYKSVKKIYSNRPWRILDFI